MSDTPIDLDALRQRIDALDSDILRLINERAAAAQQVAQVKTAEDPKAVFYRPEREAQVLRRIMALNKGPLDSEEVARLFREIMSACLALEQPIKVAYLGPEGTFTQQAAIKHFGESAISLPMAAIDEVFREVEAGAVNYGVVPVENSTEGVINHTLDSFMDSGLRICGEVVLRIHHHLLVAETTRQDKVSRIYSHPQSFAQCRKWLDAHFPHAERVPVSSNAEAARLVKTEWHSAAIAGDMAAKLYDLTRLAEKIEDRQDKVSRIYSHPQSFAQCRKWLDAHFPHAERVPVSSNAEAARLVKTEWHSAAIAGDMAAKLYDLTRLAEKIEDRPDNSTRFLIIGHQDVPMSGEDKTSIVVAMRNQPGALHDLLEPFHRHQIDMTRLETRPSRSGVWNYVFFIDFKGHRDEPRVAAVLEEVRLRAAEVKVLGSYPIGVL